MTAAREMDKVLFGPCPMRNVFTEEVSKFPLLAHQDALKEGRFGFFPILHCGARTHTLRLHTMGEIGYEKCSATYQQTCKRKTPVSGAASL